MAKYKIVQDHENCISCGSCVAVCPDFWQEADDSKMELKKGNNHEQEIDDLDCNMDAAKACPVNVIHIFEGEKKLI
jgi:ferredoxin|tara:strand:+ start:101 stop:328 length:228 start_codon:yes stop_codon:yes gene_type:complete